MIAKMECETTQNSDWDTKPDTAHFPQPSTFPVCAQRRTLNAASKKFPPSPEMTIRKAVTRVVNLLSTCRANTPKRRAFAAAWGKESASRRLLPHRHHCLAWFTLGA